MGNIDLLTFFRQLGNRKQGVMEIQRLVSEIHGQ